MTGESTFYCVVNRSIVKTVKSQHVSEMKYKTFGGLNLLTWRRGCGSVLC